MTPSAAVPAERFDMAGILRERDLVVCGQVCAEPRSLTRRLVAAATRHRLALRVFVGTLFSDTFATAPPSMRFLSYGAIGTASALADRQLLDVMPEHYSRLPRLFSDGRLRADVVLLQAALGPDGTPSFGLACDYLREAARAARVVIVELNPQAPWTHGTPWPADLRVDHWVLADEAPLELPLATIDDTARAIARHVAALVPEGATLQVGVGTLPDATLQGLAGHRRLGLHTGILGDAGIALIRSGTVDNSAKSVDAGITVTNTVCASARSFAFLHRNPEVEVRHSDATHGAAVLAALPRLHAINSALEVDLSGQVNCEELQGRSRGGIGGLLDFSRGALQSVGGRSILVLPSTAAKGTASRIVPALRGAVTIGRGDVDTVITEHGVAHLRGVPLTERARRLAAIAAPQFRENLERNERNFA